MKKLVVQALTVMFFFNLAAQQTDKVTYARPEGAYYLGPEDWVSNTMGTVLLVKPWTNLTFKNLCSNKSTSLWKDYFGNTSYNIDADKNFNMTVNTAASYDGYWFYDRVVPSISVGSTSYTLGQESRFWDANYGSAISTTFTSMPMSLVDCSRVVGTNSAGAPQFNLFTSSPDFRYIIGTTSVSSSTTTYYQKGLVQLFDRPMGPLFIDKVTIAAFSYSLSEIPASSLTMKFYKVNIYDDGSKHRGEEIYSMPCDKAESIGHNESIHGQFNRFVLTFNRKNPTDQILLDDEFFVEIDGFYNNGMDIGLAVAYIDEPDKPWVTAAMVSLLDQNKQATTKLATLNNNIVAALSLFGYYDNIIADDKDIKIPDAGESQACATVRTCLKWNYGSEDAAYTIEGLPAWLTVEVDESKHDFANLTNTDYELGNGKNTLTSKAQQLPADVEGRQAVITIYGKGVSDNITITQGKVEASIHNITIDNNPSQPVFDLTGRRASKNMRGVVIKGGKKIIN